MENKGKLGLDKNIIEKARGYARLVALDTQKYIDAHTTVATERAVLRLLGVDGVDELGVPLSNVFVDELRKKELLSDGAAYYMGRAVAAYGISPAEFAVRLSMKEADITGLPELPPEKALRL